MVSLCIVWCSATLQSKRQRSKSAAPGGDAPLPQQPPSDHEVHDEDEYGVADAATLAESLEAAEKTKAREALREQKRRSAMAVSDESEYPVGRDALFGDTPKGPLVRGFARVIQLWGGM